MQFKELRKSYECDSSLQSIFESDNFRFPFSTKNSSTWLSDIRKIILLGNLLDKIRKLYSYRKFQAILQISQKTVVVTPPWVRNSFITTARNHSLTDAKSLSGHLFHSSMWCNRLVPSMLLAPDAWQCGPLSHSLWNTHFPPGSNPYSCEK